MKPFDDDSSVVSLSDLTIENGTDRVVLHGSIAIDRTIAGLDIAKRLKAHIDDVVATLEAMDLPETLPAGTPVGTVVNPFEQN